MGGGRTTRASDTFPGRGLAQIQDGSALLCGEVRDPGWRREIVPPTLYRRSVAVGDWSSGSRQLTGGEAKSQIRRESGQCLVRRH